MAKEAYKKLLNSRDTSFKELGLSSYKSYNLVDINKDGVPELILSTADGSTEENSFYMECQVFTYNKGKVKHLKSLESDAGGIRYNNKSKVIITNQGGTGGYTSNVYQLKNNKLSKVIQLKDVRDEAVEFFINGKKVSSNKYTQEMNKYWLKDNLSFIKIISGNLNSL